VGHICVEISVLGVNVSEGDHRHVIGRRIGNAERKPIRKGDAGTVLCGWREQPFVDLESADKVSPLGVRCLETVFFRVSENEIEREEPGLDVSEFMLSPIAEIVSADGRVELSRVEVIDETPPSVSLSTSMPQAKQFFDQTGIALAALGPGKV
jgi:hypothetical protein